VRSGEVVVVVNHEVPDNVRDEFVEVDAAPDDPEAPEADMAEQRRPVIPSEEEPEMVETPVEAADADLAEQQRPVPVDEDEDYR
jgi:hypothetical protein